MTPPKKNDFGTKVGKIKRHMNQEKLFGTYFLIPLIFKEL
jgi:hypothetical protein